MLESLHHSLHLAAPRRELKFLLDLGLLGHWKASLRLRISPTSPMSSFPSLLSVVRPTLPPKRKAAGKTARRAFCVSLWGK